MLKPSIIAIVACLPVACATPPDVEVTHAPATVTEKISPHTSSKAEQEETRCHDATKRVDWLAFFGRFESLSGQELARERDRILLRHRERPSDGSRLALGYLMTQPHVLVNDVDQGQLFLAEIDAGSTYAPIRDLLLRELAMVSEIAKLQTQTTQLQSQLDALKAQLDALKAIDADLTENQKEIEEVGQ